MPMVIEHIDAIARKKQSDVLYLEFGPEVQDECFGIMVDPSYEFTKDEARRKILDWLDMQGIGWTMCGDYANVHVMASYQGQIYLDVPYDETDPTYCKLRDYLEYPDGTIRHQNVRFYICSLEMAMKNAEHDEPGFWDRWAESF